MSNSQDNQLRSEEMVRLYLMISYDLESLSLKKLKRIAKSMNVIVNVNYPRLSDCEAKQRIISVLKSHITNDLNSQDNQLRAEEMVRLYHKGTRITYEDLETLSLKKLKRIAKSMNVIVNVNNPRLSDCEAKQRIISVLKVHITNDLNPFLQYEDDGHVQKKKIKKSRKPDKPVTLLEFPCQNPNVKNFSMEFEISFTQK